MIKGIHHANICIPDGTEAKARAFYIDLLGLAEVPKPETLRLRGGFWLMAGTSSLHISTEATPNSLRESTGAHLAYEVDDLEAWRKKLSEAGLKIEECPPIPSWPRFQIRDPFGNRIEIIQPVT